MSHGDKRKGVEDRFPWKTLLLLFALWIVPVGLFSIPVNMSGFLSVIILLVIVLSIPIITFVLYVIDKRRAGGYVSVWGYR